VEYQTKFEILSEFSKYLKGFEEVLEFTVKGMAKQLKDGDAIESTEFDFLLDLPTMRQLKKLDS